MVIYSGNKECLGSGTIVAAFDEEITFTLFEDVKVVVKFEKTQDSKEITVTSKVDKNLLVMSFTNFNNVFGNSSTTLFNVGSVKNINIYLGFAIYHLGDEKEGTKVFHYTWYKEQKEAGK